MVGGDFNEHFSCRELQASGRRVMLKLGLSEERARWDEKWYRIGESKWQGCMTPSAKTVLELMEEHNMVVAVPTDIYPTFFRFGGPPVSWLDMWWISAEDLRWVRGVKIWGPRVQQVAAA